MAVSSGGVKRERAAALDHEAVNGTPSTQNSSSSFLLELSRELAQLDLRTGRAAAIGKRTR